MRLDKMKVTNVRFLFGCLLVLATTVTICAAIIIIIQQKQHDTRPQQDLSHEIPLAKKTAPQPPTVVNSPPSKVVKGSLTFVKTTPHLHGQSRTRFQESTQSSSRIGTRDVSTTPGGKLETTYETDRETILRFKDAVRRNTGSDGIIFLSTFDSGYVAMALNLYLTSYAPFNISNSVFIATDGSACRLLVAGLLPLPVTCIQYFADSAGNSSSSYGSANFKRKTHYKTKIILETLRLGVTVVIVDLDIVFFKHPVAFMKCASCDVQIQSDVMENNSGFYMARPTNASIELHEKALQIAALNPQLSSQKVLSRTIVWANRQKRIRIETLDDRQFPCGRRFFDDQGVMFAGDQNNCSECVLVHNNWITGQDTKIYRFRETGLWQVDAGGYYSDPTRKYLAYENPNDYGPNSTLKHEKDALRVGLFLGALLNRTLILPDFNCYGCNSGACNNTRRRCAFNTHFRFGNFDREFTGLYREHVFLRHPKVPTSVKRDLSRPVFIVTVMTPPSTAAGLDVDVLTASNVTRGPTEAELVSWLGRGPLVQFSVLRFHSLYGLFPAVQSMISTRAKSTKKGKDWRPIFARKLSRSLSNRNIK